MTYWMEVARWLLIGAAAGAALGETVWRPLLKRHRRRAAGR